MADASRLSIVALVAALAALVWAAVLHWRTPHGAPCNCGAVASSAAAAPPTPLSQAVGPLAVQMTSLERRIDKLESVAGDAGFVASPDGGAARALEPTRFVSLVSPSSAVRVEQVEGGAFAAHNTDPKLTGTTLVVEGRRADGTVEKISITVPPPEK